MKNENKIKTNNATYMPDGWTILKITPHDNEIQPHFRIFATWRWGNEEWRLSSGANTADDIRIEENNYAWPQASGSIYKMPFTGEGYRTMWQGQVMNKIIKDAKDAQIADIEIVQLKDIVDRGLFKLN